MLSVKINLSRLGIAALTGLWSGAALAASLPNSSAELVTIYSNLCMHSESGDVLGERLILIWEDGTPQTVLFQTIAGWPRQSELVSAEFDGDVLTFALSGADKATFEGKITPKEVIGSFSDGRQSSFGGKVFHWVRSENSYKVRDCTEADWKSR